MAVMQELCMAKQLLASVFRMQNLCQQGTEA